MTSRKEELAEFGENPGLSIAAERGLCGREDAKELPFL
jgi:hypothetical protein